jgi:tetratricopeptide (TPR) repeat protein
MKAALRASKPVRAKKVRHPNRIPPLALACGGALLLAGFAALPRVSANPRLAGSVLGAAAGLLVLLFLVKRDASRRARTLSYRFVPHKVHYVQLAMHSSLYSYWGWYWHQVYLFLPLVAAQILFAYVLDMLVCWRRRDQWVLGFGPFPIVLSTNLFLWFKDDWFFLQFLMVATGVLCKEFVRWDRDGRRTHIFNPSAIALFVFSIGLIATGATSISWGEEIATTFARPPNIYIEIFVLGIIVQALFSVTLVTLSSAAMLYILNLAYTQATGVYFFVDSNIPAAVFLGLHLLVTDPATSPKRPLGKMVFGALYGAAVFALYGVLTAAGAPGFYDKLLCVPVLNLTVRALDRWAGRFRPLPWTHGWSPRQLNFAHMGIWIPLFGVMAATGFVGPRHPGRESEFWRAACEQGRWGACKTWEQTLQVTCRGESSAQCLTRAREFYQLFNLAKDGAERGRYDAAIPSFERALELNPESVRARTNLANALTRRGRLDEAVAQYRKALDANPQYIEAETNLGVALAEQGKFGEAEACYRRALEMEPNYIEARADLGVALFRQGRPDESVAELERALAVRPDFSQAHTNLGVVLIQKGKLDEAASHFERALQGDGANGEAQANLGMILLQKGRPDEAIPHLEKAVAITPDSPELHTNLGGALAERGRLDQAIPHFQKAVALSPDSAPFRANLAAALEQRGR